MVSASGGIAEHTKGKRSKTWKGEKYRGYQISTNENGEFFSSLDPESMYETLAEVRRSVDSWLKGHHKNPNGAESLSKKWHGRDVDSTLEITETESYADELAELADLEELGILASDQC